LGVKTKTSGSGPRERHRSQHAGWLRASVLGADDGIVSVASLSIGVIASGASHRAALAAAVASLVAGSMSMAAGEYVSVSSQRDTELSDLAKERSELAADPVGETNELANIYRKRGVPDALATQVAVALMAHDAIGAHARDELGLGQTGARPVQAGLSSAFSFALGAAFPLLALRLATARFRVVATIAASIIGLVALGVAGAKAGGAGVVRAAVRVGLGGSAAIAVTALVGHLFGAATG
jgi:VIT1/CCC1 family predicted Fe2+/Mn2+ transporter